MCLLYSGTSESSVFFHCREVKNVHVHVYRCVACIAKRINWGRLCLRLSTPQSVHYQTFKCTHVHVHVHTCTCIRSTDTYMYINLAKGGKPLDVRWLHVEVRCVYMYMYMYIHSCTTCRRQEYLTLNAYAARVTAVVMCLCRHVCSSVFYHPSSCMFCFISQLRYLYLYLYSVFSFQPWTFKTHAVF